MSVAVFGRHEGKRVQAVTIKGGGLTATVMEWGCVMLDLRLDQVDRSLILSWSSLEDYVRHGREHVGAIAGRCANRIRGGQFYIDGEAFQVDRNVAGRDTLHGGERGFGRSFWTLVERGVDHATFRIKHADGVAGFPGAIEAQCIYRLADGVLMIDLTATTDAPTLCNLAQHNYYNLSGAARIDDHVLEVAATRHTPLAEDMAPTGQVVTNVPMLDFIKGRTVGDQALDLNYVIADARTTHPRPAASLSAGDIKLVIETTEPGLQVYTAEHLPHWPRAGICLEAQLWPDAPNHPGFPNAILRPGEVYHQQTHVRLSQT
jgi:aldose 1-epimerase